MTDTAAAAAGRSAIMQPAPAPSIEAKVAFLRRPDAYPHRPASIEVIETHMSWIFLSGERVYKMKKPVRYAFLDFTTLESRGQNCEREVQLNRRLAADVYLGVVPLTLTSDAGLEFDGKGPVAEWLVEMRRLPAQRMLDAAIRAGTVNAVDIRNVARCLTLFYRRAERIDTGAAAYRRGFAEGIQANRAELTEPRYGLPAPQIERLTEAQLRFLATKGAMLQQRAVAGRIVDAHGNLRPEHICLTEQPRIIDCLEFRREFRLLDPADELAYLAMECERLGARAIGDAVLRQCLEASGDAPPEDLIGFYKAFRACLRAKIAVWHIADHEVRDTEKWRRRAGAYLQLAESYAARL